MNKLQHVLCVDDEKDILNITKFALENLGQFKVTTCANGKEAINQVIGLNPDIILLDVMMPEMDGFATLSALKQIKDVMNIPVVFMTAKVQSSEIESYIAMGAVGVIAKPFDPLTLSETVKEYWQAAQAKA